MSTQFRSSAFILTVLVLAGFDASAQVVQWARQFGSSRVEEAFAVAVAPNAVYTTGSTVGSFPDATNAGNSDGFVSKNDLAGNPGWTRQFGTSVGDYPLGVAADASGVYVVGYTFGSLPGQTNAGGEDVFIRKYDPNGNELWTRQFGTSNPDVALAAAVDSTGFYVAGKTAGALPGQTSGSLGQDDAFLRKYDPNGTELWTRQFGTSSGDRGRGVAADGTSVYVTGDTGGPIAGPAAAGGDGFLRKYSSSGTVAWTKQIASSGNGNDIAYAVAAHSSGVYVTGETTGTFEGQTKFGSIYDAWAQKFDANGTVQWTRQIGSSTDDNGYGIAVANQWVYVVGFTGNQDGLLQRYDLNGGGTSTSPLASTDREYLYAVAADASGAYVVGSKSGNTLGQTPLGDADALLVKIPHPPEIDGVSDAFTGQAGVAPTTWTSLYGRNLASALTTWDSAIRDAQLPKLLDGISVQINGQAATIYFVSPWQVNVLTPLDATASATVPVTLTNPYGTSPTVLVAKTAVLPAFYAPFAEGNKLFVTAVGLDGSLLGKPGLDPRVGRAPRPGEVAQFFATGFGATNPAAPSDLVVSGAPGVITRPRITIGGREASFVGNGNLVAPGLYQFNITIPDVADGDHAIVAEIGTAKSAATVFLTVKR